MLQLPLVIYYLSFLLFSLYIYVAGAYQNMGMKSKHGESWCI